MVKKAVCEVMAYAERNIKDIIVSWERHFPSGHSPLMSLRNPSEKEAENPCAQPIIRAGLHVYARCWVQAGRVIQSILGSPWPNV